MAAHSSMLAWRIPWTEESGGLQSMELHRVGHDWRQMWMILALSLTSKGVLGKITLCFSITVYKIRELV